MTASAQGGGEMIQQQQAERQQRAQQAFGGRRVLVTGGCGFIGSHLVDALVAAGAQVRVLDDLSTGRRVNLQEHLPSVAGECGMAPADTSAASSSRVELLIGDLRDQESCRRAVDGVEVVFHQAALGSVPRSMEDPATSVAVNVAGTTNLFAAARDAGVQRVVYASSSSVYGDDARLPKREGQEGRPLSPYALSKVQCEELAEVFGRAYGMKFIGLRYFNVYGPRQDPAGPYAAVIPRFFDACAAGRSPTIYGDGEQSRDFTYVADAVEANLAAAAAESEGAWGRAYNVGGGHATTVNQLVARVRELAGGPDPVHEPPRAGDVRASLADVAAASAAFGYRPIWDLAAGLDRAREHYLGQGLEAGGA
ncbi:MAG: NAD-dependent epimerase/dehydratase family protein [Acidobacteriota bacterium]